MRVLLINQVFYPDVAATAQLAHDLAEDLVSHGHEVDVIASRSIYGERGAPLSRRESLGHIEIHRVGRSFFGKASLPARLLDFVVFYVAATVKALTVRRPDAVICFTTPPFIALVGWLLRLLRGSRFVYWVMDLYPEVPVGCGVMRQDSLACRFFESLNRFCLARADRVVVLGRCMMKRVLDKGIDPGHVHFIGVWCDPTEVRPIPEEENPYRALWKVQDKFVVMYSGNFGLAHDVTTMCEAAAMLADDDRIAFLFVGGGKKKPLVERFIAEHGLGNCRCEPYQPRERLDRSLSCADVHLVSLLEGLEGSIVPSKLFGIMAAARPTIYIGHPESEIARVLLEHECGTVVRQGDVEGLVESIRFLALHPQERARQGAAARAALCRAYDREAACGAWRELLEELTGTRPDVRQRSEPGGSRAEQQSSGF